MNENVVDMMARKIADYITYLETNHELSISIKFSRKYNFICSIEGEIGKSLRKYFEHTNIYCVYVKNAMQLTRKCVLCTMLAMKKSRSLVSYTGMCHAGVCEYVHRFRCGDDIAGIVNVTAYRAKNIPYGQNEWYDEGMKDEEMPLELLETVIPPLCAMLSEMIPQIKKSGIYDSVYTRMLAFINEQHTDTSLDSLSRQFNYSKSYISHMFKRESGYTLKEYCNLLKIEDAKILLEDSDASVTNIALSVGYNNFSYFINTFKRLTGKTPLAWRKEALARRAEYERKMKKDKRDGSRTKKEQSE